MLCPSKKKKSQRLCRVLTRRCRDPVWRVFPRQLCAVPTAVLVRISTGQARLEQPFLSLRTRRISPANFASQPDLV